MPFADPNKLIMASQEDDSDLIQFEWIDNTDLRITLGTAVIPKNNMLTLTVPYEMLPLLRASIEDKAPEYLEWEGIIVEDSDSLVEAMLASSKNGALEILELWTNYLRIKGEID